MIQKIILFFFLFLFSFIIINNSNALFNSPTLSATNLTTSDSSFFTINANRWDIINIKATWYNWGIRDIWVWFEYIFENWIPTWVSDISNWINLIADWSNWPLAIWSIYNFWQNTIISTNYNTWYGNALFSFEFLTLKIDLNYCSDEPIIINWRWLSNNYIWELIGSVTINIIDNENCVPSNNIYNLSLDLFTNINLNWLNINDVPILNSSGSVIWYNYNNHFINNNKILFQILIVLIIWIFMIWIYTFYFLIKDLLWN